MKIDGVKVNEPMVAIYYDGSKESIDNIVINVAMLKAWRYDVRNSDYAIVFYSDDAEYQDDIIDTFEEKRFPVFEIELERTLVIWIDDDDRYHLSTITGKKAEKFQAALDKVNEEKNEIFINWMLKDLIYG